MKLGFGNRILTVKEWISKNRFEFFIFLIILFVGAFFRLYKIDQYMLFLGDEGRDATIVRRFLVNGDLMFVGPGTSVGNMYLGPLYYYLIAPFLLLFNFSPVGPSVFVALVGVATIYLVWLVTRVWFPTKEINWAAAIAASLYAISPVVIIQSRSSWNPNIMPFFALLTVFSLWKISIKKKLAWLVILAVSFSVVLQSHYLGLILIPVIAIYLFRTFFWSLKKPKSRSSFFKYTMIFLLITFLMLLPLILFDVKHRWRNFQAVVAFFSGSGSVSLNLKMLFAHLINLISLFVTRLLAAKSILVGKLTLGYLVLAGMTILIVRREKYQKQKYASWSILVLWFVFALVGLGVYRENIWDHYFGFLFPALFILIGALSKELMESYRTIGKYIVIFSITSLMVFNLLESPIKQDPNNQMQRAINISQKIIFEADGERFNLAVIAEKNYEGAYQYYLEKAGAPLVMIDPMKAKETIADQLFVVCEYSDKNMCQPTSNPKTEVANFGWSKIDSSWELDGLILFKLIHNESGKP